MMVLVRVRDKDDDTRGSVEVSEDWAAAKEVPTIVGEEREL